MAIGTYNFFWEAHDISIKYGNGVNVLNYGYSISAMEILGILAALKFMFDIRKSKK